MWVSNTLDLVQSKEESGSGLKISAYCNGQVVFTMKVGSAKRADIRACVCVRGQDTDKRTHKPFTLRVTTSITDTAENWQGCLVSSSLIH